MNHQAQLVTILGELAGALDGRAFFDVLQNLLVAGFVANDQQTTARVLHRLQSFVIRRHSRSAGPGELQRFQLGAKLDSPRFLNVEGVIVEEKFSYIRPIIFGGCHLTSYVVSGAFSPRVTAQSLRPEAKRALRRATASGVQGYVRV